MSGHTSGQRLHALILFGAFAYLVLHVWLGARLIGSNTPFTGLLLMLTVLSAVGNLVVAVPLWVYAGVALVRGPKPLVALPERVPDAALPTVIVQVPGRHEPFEEVRRSVDSVLVASYPREKLFVQFVDNSDDDRWREVEAYYRHEPRVSVEHRDGTRGFKGGNLNYGLKKIEAHVEPSSTLIGLLDVGDTFAPEVLRPMATEFVHDRRMGFVQDMFRIGNPSETIINWSDYYVGDAARRYTEGYAAHYGLPTMNGHCALLRLAALDETGRWNESRIAEDWSTGISMLASGWHGKWVDYEPTNPRMVSTELVPGDITGQQKQKRRWATGGTELARHHLWGWLRSDMPWHYRMSLLLRLGANFSVLPSFLVQLLFPVWLALALIGEGSTAVLAFGLVSAVAQNPYFMANAAAALNYAREGRGWTGWMVVLAYPVQAFWRLPVFAHAGVGIVEGLTRGLKEFVITPKRAERASPLRIIGSQGLVVVVSLLTTLPLLAVALMRPERIDALVVAVLALPLSTILALFLVPSTQWVRTRLRPARESAPDDGDDDA